MAEGQQNIQCYTGHVLENKLPNDTDIFVYVANISPNIQTSEFTKTLVENTILTKDSLGNITQNKTYTTNKLRATWEGSSNTPYPPMVVKGEQVEIYQINDTNKFFWRALGRDRTSRTTDQYRLEVAATDIVNQEKDDSNTYFIELDSVKKKNLVIQTSQKNGEKTTYRFEMNGKDGYLIITDSQSESKNRIVINSKEDTIQINNNQSSSIILDKKNVAIKCDSNIMLNAGKQIILDSPSVTVNKATEGNVVINSNNLSINSKRSTVIGGESLGINSKTKISKNLSTTNVKYEQLSFSIFENAYESSGIDISDGSHSSGKIISDEESIINVLLNDKSVSRDKLETILNEIVTALNEAKVSLHQETIEESDKISNMGFQQLYGKKF